MHIFYVFHQVLRSTCLFFLLDERFFFDVHFLDPLVFSKLLSLDHWITVTQSSHISVPPPAPQDLNHE
jgi:hypothetical protein